MGTITKKRLLIELEGTLEEGYTEIEDTVTKEKRRIYIDGRLEGFGKNEVVITSSPKALISIMLTTLKRSTVVE